jgi:hypothetical protein
VREKNVNFYQLEQTVSTREVKGWRLKSSSHKLNEVQRGPFTRLFRFPKINEGRAALSSPYLTSMLGVMLGQSGHPQVVEARRNYSLSPAPRPGSGRVFSTRTDLRAWGSRPKARRMVGATCAVVTGLLMVFAASPGIETSKPTLVSL